MFISKLEAQAIFQLLSLHYNTCIAVENWFNLAICYLLKSCIPPSPQPQISTLINIFIFILPVYFFPFNNVVSFTDVQIYPSCPNLFKHSQIKPIF